MAVLIAQKMLDGASNDNDVAVADLSRLGCLETTHIIDWGAGVQSGTVQIEVASDPAYAGTWASVYTATFDPTVGDAPRQDYIRVPGMYAAMRHRVDGVVESGFVSSRIDASGDIG